MAAETERVVHEGCHLHIGSLDFVEEHCVIEGNGKKYLVFSTKIGRRTIRIKLPEGAWEYDEARDALVLSHENDLAKEIEAYLRAA